MNNNIDNEKDYDYSSLRQRGDVAIELFMTTLKELDLFASITVTEEGKADEIIFSDRTEYIKNGNKRGVGAEFKILNAVFFESEEDIPEHIVKKHKDNIIRLERDEDNN